jgi:hypothetical protein
MAQGFVRDDGGRAAAGFKGSAGDCVARAVAIASGRPYAEVYRRLAEGMGAQRRTKRTLKKHERASARNGITTKRKWFKDYMAELGFEWVPTMGIGTGCQVHLTADELPSGRIIAAVSGHYTAVIDGVIHDTFDPRRETHYVRSGGGGAGGPDELRPGEWRNQNGICGISRRCVYGYWHRAESPA